VSVAEVIPARAIALPEHRIRQAARAAGQSWLEWLSLQLVAGLWAERYKGAVLALYSPTTPLRIFLCSRSQSAQFIKVYKRLYDAIDDIETGRSAIPPSARPVVLWQPPSTMVRLWPPPDRRVSDRTPLVVDTALSSYYSTAIDPSNLSLLEHDVDQRMDYAIVPREEHASFVVAGREFQYVNRFFELPQPARDSARAEPVGETGDPEVDDMLDDFRTWLLRNYGR